MVFLNNIWVMMIMYHYTKFDRNCPGKHLLKFRTFTMTLTLNTAKKPFHKLRNVHCQTKSPKNEQFRTSNSKSYFICINRNSVTVTLKIETHFSHMRLWLIMMTHHTGFDFKWFSDAQDIQTLPKCLTFAVTLTFNRAIQYFHWTLLCLLWSTLKLSLVAKDSLV